MALGAFGESVPIGIVGAIIIFVFALVKIKPLAKAAIVSALPHVGVF